MAEKISRGWALMCACLTGANRNRRPAGEARRRPVDVRLATRC
jgi:hypothetical protein